MFFENKLKILLLFKMFGKDFYFSKIIYQSTSYKLQLHNLNKEEMMMTL